MIPLTISKHITLLNRIINFFGPQPLIHQIAFLLILRSKEGKLAVTPPFLFKCPFIIRVVLEIDLLFLDFAEIVCNA